METFSLPTLVPLQREEQSETNSFPILGNLCFGLPSYVFGVKF